MDDNAIIKAVYKLDPEEFGGVVMDRYKRLAKLARADERAKLIEVLEELDNGYENGIAKCLKLKELIQNLRWASP